MYRRMPLREPVPIPRQRHLHQPELEVMLSRHEVAPRRGLLLVDEHVVWLQGDDL